MNSDRSDLVSRARLGNVTLVLGAGVSQPFGVPSWGELARRLWVAAFPGQPSPWTAPADQTPQSLPQFLPIVFERAARKLNETGDAGFATALRMALYADVKSLPTFRVLATSRKSLAVIARTLAREHGREGRRRIDRVVTFNVDDLLEILTNRFSRHELHGQAEAVRSVARAMKAPLLPGGEEAPGTLPIPVYHLHGKIYYRPHPAMRAYEHRYVFTDSQYWESASSVLSFPNRSMGAALSESCCIFIGTSMTDINMLRWLALTNSDIENDIREYSLRKPPPRPGSHTIYFYGPRHFWVRPECDDKTGFLSTFLRDRGVSAVPISSWKGPSFAQLLEECFPPDDGHRRRAAIGRTNRYQARPTQRRTAGGGR